MSSSIDVPRICVAFALVFSGLACDGSIGDHGRGGGGGSGMIGGGGPTNVDPGTITVPPAPLDARTAFTATSKAKNLLTGLAVTDEDVTKVTERGAAGLQELVSTWLTTDPYQVAVGGKLVIFFRNMFQQTGFLPTEDFKLQLLTNGGFDFGNARNVGDDAFPRLVQNLQDSFAMTAWQLVKEGRPFTETLTTRRFVMTTALKSLYIQIEMPPDNGRTTTAGPAWTIDYSGNAIPIEQALTTMTFSDEAPAITTQTGNAVACRGGAVVATGAFQGTSRLFQRLLGFTPQFPQSGTEMCSEHASKPYFTAEDVSDWRWVTINQKAGTDRTPPIQPYDLPALRATTELTLSLPRVGFYTTPAFLALWNTNDSNQHRVTANQTLLVAFGQAFTAANAITPFTTAGLDENHAVTGGECIGCHLTLDPMRQFWGNQFDYNDRNDFQAASRNNPGNPRPTGAVVNEFAFGDVAATGSNMADLGGFLTRVTDGAGLPRFAISVVQQLCYYTNSAACSEVDPEFRRIVGSFRDSSFNFAVLLKEFFASPLFTGASPTASYPGGEVPVSIARRDHLCASLSNRLGRADLCAQAAVLPTTAQRATAVIASSVASDAFSRGAEVPVTPADPTLFYRAATELLCENIAIQVVDGATDTVYSSADVPGAISAMVQTVMGYPPGHALHAQAVQVLTDHNTAAAAQITNRNNKARDALRSTFALACESPRALGIGL